MKKLLLSFLLVTGLLSGTAMAKDAGSLVINVTTSDNIDAPMALMFATKGLEKGLKMTVWLNAEGVRLAVKGFNPPSNARDGKNTHEMLANFIKKGGKVLVCPMCLKAQGYDKDDLVSGVILSDADITFEAILNSDKVISF